MAKIQFQLSGFKELEDALKNELPKATARNAMRRAALTAMAPVVEAAQNLAPKKSGALAMSIGVQVLKAQRVKGSSRFQSQGGSITVQAGPMGVKRSMNYYNAFWQEYGTVKMPANPFMRPAADAATGNVLDILRSELLVQIDKAKSRIARRAAKAK